MAGWFRNTAAYLGLVEDGADGEVREVREVPRREPRSVRPEPRVEAPREERPRTHEVRSATLSREAARPVEAPRSLEVPATEAPAEIARIVTLHPRSYNDARRIGEEFREGTPVIMNLTEMDDTDAKRLVDFAAGLAFGLRGGIERITTKVFLISPANVDVGAAARAQLDNDGFFNRS